MKISNLYQLCRIPTGYLPLRTPPHYQLSHLFYTFSYIKKQKKCWGNDIFVTFYWITFYLAFQLFNFKSYTVWKVISSNWRCQNVPLSITDMFVIDHKENVTLINNKLFVIKQGLFPLWSITNCYYSDCWNGIKNSLRTLPLLSRNKSQTCARSQVLRKKIQRAISGLGTFINNIESIGQDGCMTDKVSQDRFLDTLA